MRKSLTVSLLAGATFLSSFATFAQADDRPELTIAMAAMQRLHPAVAESNFDSRVIKSVMDGLLNRDWLNGPNGNDGTEIVPGIFTAWEQIDELTWEFKVRQGVKFHHGREMTAEDAAFTISQERFEIRPHNLASSLEKVTVIDDETIQVKTKYPDPVLLHRLAHVIGHVVPAELYRERGYEGFGAAPVGTGPYYWAESVADDYIVLKAFDEYWGGKPPFSQITFKSVPETSARIAGLITGEYDIITSIPPDQAELIDREGDYETRSIEVENMHHLTFMTGCGEEGVGCDRGDGREAAVRNPLVRKAMIMAVDRQKIADRLWNGLAKVPAGPNWEMYGDLFDADRAPIGFDPEGAKALLEEAGYDGQEIVIAVTAGYYVNGDRAVQVMMQMWEAVGLNVRLQFVENWGQQRPYGWQDIWINSSNIRIPDPLSPWWWRFAEPSASYLARNVQEPTEEYLRVGNILERTLDSEMRIQSFHEGLDEWQEQNPALIMYRPIEIYGVRKDLQWTPYSFYWMDFRDYNVSFEGQ